MNKNKKALRILHCPTVVGGHPSGLAKAERALGHQSLAVAFKPTSFGHAADQHLCTNSTSRWHMEWLRWKLLYRAFRNYDVIHYNFGSSILDWQITGRRKSRIFNMLAHGYANFCYWIEKKLLNNKVIAVTYQGDDARQGDYSLNTFHYSIAQEVDHRYYSAESDQRKRNAIAQFNHFADLIYALNPDLLHVLPARAKFVTYAHINFEDWQVTPNTPNQQPVVLHAPSHFEAKGTRFILEAVNRLQQEGVDFEFVLVENKPHCEAKKLYERCDLVIDQLLAGWYGGFAVEAMALGKPVICYIRQEDLSAIPAEMQARLPIIQATPDTIYEVLHEWLVIRVNELAARGRASRRFVEEWNDPISIARSIIKDYEYYLSI